MGNRLDPPHLLTIQEVCRDLHLSRSTLHELIRDGELASVKIGRSRRVRSDSIREFIDRHSTFGSGA